MFIRTKIFENFNFGEVTLRNAVLEKVWTFKYLGHIITDDSNDDTYIMRYCRYLYGTGNSIIRKFWYVAYQKSWNFLGFTEAMSTLVTYGIRICTEKLPQRITPYCEDLLTSLASRMACLIVPAPCLHRMTLIIYLTNEKAYV